MRKQRRRRCRVVVEEVDDALVAAPKASAPSPLPETSAATPAAVAAAPAPAASAPALATAASARQAAIDAAREKRLAAQKRKAEWEASKNKKGGGGKRSKSAKSGDVLAKAIAEIVFPEDADSGLAKELGLASMGIGDGVLQSMQLPTMKTRAKPVKRQR